MKKSVIFKIIVTLLIAIVSVHSVAIYYSWYFYHLWLDMPMHFFGGFLVALSTLWFIYISKKINIPVRYREADTVFIISLVIISIVGLLWEIFEFSFQTFIVLTHTFDIADTLSDLAFDVSGALAASTLFTSNQLYKK